MKRGMYPYELVVSFEGSPGQFDPSNDEMQNPYLLALTPSLTSGITTQVCQRPP
jgi:hypothetical protein